VTKRKCPTLKEEIAAHEFDQYLRQRRQDDLVGKIAWLRGALDTTKEHARARIKMADDRAAAAFDKIATLVIPPDEFRETARRLAGFAKQGEWNAVKKILTNYKIVGSCSNCGINVYGKEVLPDPGTMPCNTPGCPFEKSTDQHRLTVEDLEEARFAH